MENENKKAEKKPTEETSNKRPSADAPKKKRVSNAPPRKQVSQKKLYIIYAVLGTILLTFIVLIILKSMPQKEAPVVYVPNDIEKGIDICKQALAMYDQDNKKASEALAKFDEGMLLAETKLDKKRDADGNLPAKYTEFEKKIEDLRNSRGPLRDKTLSQTQKAEVKTEKKDETIEVKKEEKVEEKKAEEKPAP